MLRLHLRLTLCQIGWHQWVYVGSEMTGCRIYRCRHCPRAVVTNRL